MSCDGAVVIKTTFINNHDNNGAGAELALSDLYACKIPLQMKILNGTQKTKKVDFASVEHAWYVRRMIRQPQVNTSRKVVTVANMEQIFVTTQADALYFLAQFNVVACLRHGAPSIRIIQPTSFAPTPRANITLVLLQVLCAQIIQKLTAFVRGSRAMLLIGGRTAAIW